MAHVLLDGDRLGDAHPPLDAAQDGARLVEAEIDAGFFAEQAEQVVELVLLGDQPAGLVGRALEVGMADELEQGFGHQFGRQDEIGQSGGDGATGHAAEFGRVFFLNHHHAARFLDGSNATGAVAAGAGQNDAHRALALILGQGLEEDVDRQHQPFAMIHLAEQELAVKQGQLGLGRNQVHLVGRDLHAVDDPVDRHAGGFRQQFHHHAFVVRRKVLDHDERHPAIERHVLEKLLERFQPARRCAQPDDVRAFRDAFRGRSSRRVALRRTRSRRFGLVARFLFHGHAISQYRLGLQKNNREPASRKH